MSVVTNSYLTGCNVHPEEIIIDNETLTSFPKASKVMNIRNEYPTLLDEHNLQINYKFCPYTHWQVLKFIKKLPFTANGDNYRNPQIDPIH